MLSQLRTLHSQPQITRPASTTCHDRLIRRRPNVHAQNNPGQRTSGEKKRLFSPVSRLFPSGLETYGRLHRLEGTTMIDIPNEETPLAGPVNNVILKPRSNVTPTPLNNISAKLSNSKTGKKYELVPPDGGWGWAIVASGSIIYAMAMYGTRGAILVMAGLLLHGLVAAMLLQPVAWHMKREEVVDTGGQHKDEEQGNNILASTKLLAKNGELQENQSLEGSKETNENVSRDDSKETQICLLNSSGFHPNDFDKHRVYLNGNTTLKPQSAKRGNNKGKLSSLAVGLDLGLLKDKTFLMLLTGIWLALAAETIFVFFTPFILDDLGFTTEQITNILAVISGGDLLFRFLAPFIADWIKFDDKLMFVLSLVVAVLTRIPIMLVTSYEAMLSVGLALGASKGIMMVYRALVVPNYVPMERVSSALALQMVGVGFTVLISSPFAGVLRDLSGSYNTSVTVVNVVTVLAILIYVVEINLSRRHNRRKPS
uniref:Major facilitator superfamily (MFS) profile domain-containing protein n=1 Tax=Timema douglasi TaxID=61478 RepID=A0A7R8VD68_TIMDO|nr:unnamed protein product [Timema douglasi]